MKVMSLKKMKWWQIALLSFVVVLISGISRMKAGGDPGEQPETE